jgi:PIN domain nuclease of toxin-antitoxin system
MLRFSAADTHHALEDQDLRVLPYTANHAFFLLDLPPLHAYPFDRQIIAQALSEEIPVMTCDEKFSLYKGSQGPLVISRNLVSRNDPSRARVSSPTF